MEGAEETIADMAWRHQTEAGRYRIAARAEPEYADSLLAMAAFHEGKVLKIRELGRFGRRGLVGASAGYAPSEGSVAW